MNSVIGFILLVAVAGMVAWLVFASAGAVARRSERTRRWVLAANAFAIALGLAIGLWLSLRISETAGSPASLVAVVLLWIVGGGLAVLGAAAFLGAYFARPASAAAALSTPTEGSIIGDRAHVDSSSVGDQPCR